MPRHIGHCFDVVRKHVMCVPDMALYGTPNRVGYDIAPDGHKCQDMSAMKDWIKARTWKGNDEYFAEHKFRASIDTYNEQEAADMIAFPDVLYDHVGVKAVERLEDGGWIYEFIHSDTVVPMEGELVTMRWAEAKKNGGGDISTWEDFLPNGLGLDE